MAKCPKALHNIIVTMPLHIITSNQFAVTPILPTGNQVLALHFITSNQLVTLTLATLNQVINLITVDPNDQCIILIIFPLIIVILHYSQSLVQCLSCIFQKYYLTLTLNLEYRSCFQNFSILINPKAILNNRSLKPLDSQIVWNRNYNTINHNMYSPSVELLQLLLINSLS